MSSIISGYNYDIFISYRQKDNKGDMWVSEFVEALKTELESTFKEDINVYFDINPHDGLLETHDVDKSLKNKLKCLVFIPIISRTYCDPKSFAWEHEFKAFVEQASKDKYKLQVKLINGNVTCRVVPVRIHDLDDKDIKLYESITGSYMRGIEFIYKEPGVNRPLRANEENPHNNLNRTIYRNQVNKIALAVRELIDSMKVEKESISNAIANTKSKKQNLVNPNNKRNKPFIDESTDDTVTLNSRIENHGGTDIVSSGKYSEEKLNREKSKLDLNENLAWQIAYTQLLIKNDILHITFKRSDKILSLINELSKRIPEESDEIFNINQGGREITIVCESSNEYLLKHLLPEAEEILRKTAIIRIQEAKGSEIRPSIEVPGLYAFFIGLISDNNINILDLISTRTQLTVIIQEDDLMKAYMILNNSIKYFRNKIDSSI